MNELVATTLPKPADILVVVTLEGQIHALNKHTGDTIWTLQDPRGVLAKNDAFDAGARYPDSLLMLQPTDTGHLYIRQPGKPIQRLGLSMTKLIEMAPFRANDGSLYVGKKSTTIVGVDITTGKIVKQFGGDKSLMSLTQSSDDCFIAFFGRTEYILTVFDKDGSQKPMYNFTYISYSSPELMAATGEGKTSSYSIRSHDDLEIATDFYGSLVMKNKATQRVLWSRRLSSPVLNAFDFYLSKEADIQTFLRPELSQHPSASSNIPTNVVVGAINNMLYVLPESRYRSIDERPLVETPIQVVAKLSEHSVSVHKPEMCQVIGFEGIVGAHQNILDTIDFAPDTLLTIDSPIEKHPQWGILPPLLITLFGCLLALYIFLRGKVPILRRRLSYQHVGSLRVTDKILGYGSHGTVVYRGTFNNRPVAVKRVLHNFYEVARREVSLLSQSDDHPNVIRYFCEEKSDQFTYIALELGEATLADIYEPVHPEDVSIPSTNAASIKQIRQNLDKQQLLLEITAGLEHLHKLNIVHRDLKPQNILISFKQNAWRAMISDFGLCKKLQDDQLSFQHTSKASGGTSGWRAPETIRELTETDPKAPAPPGFEPKITKAVDMFSLGLLFFYVLSEGQHPFGDRYTRELNILRGRFALKFEECIKSPEATSLTKRLLAQHPNNRPSTEIVRHHVFFWNPNRKLTFLQDASDCLEFEQRQHQYVVNFERSAQTVLGQEGWFVRVDRRLYDNLGKYRYYDQYSLRDLLRAIRNKRSHYQELPSDLKQVLGPLPDGYFSYFEGRFPQLVIYVYDYIDNNIRLRSEPLLVGYFVPK